jgi:hypothetical protein
VFTALLLALSAGGHILLTGAALLLSGTERGFVQIAAVLVPLELALNAVYNAGQATCATGTARTGGLLPDLCGGGPVHGLESVPVLPGQLTSGRLALVFLAHVGAALVAAVWLRQGEKAVFRLLAPPVPARCDRCGSCWSGCCPLNPRPPTPHGRFPTRIVAARRRSCGTAPGGAAHRPPSRC